MKTYPTVKVIDVGGSEDSDISRSSSPPNSPSDVPLMTERHSSDCEICKEDSDGVVLETATSNRSLDTESGEISSDSSDAESDVAPRRKKFKTG